MKRQREKSFLERTAELFDLPGEIVAGQSRISITGSGRVHVDCHRGILEYGESRISLRCGKGVAVIEGENLRLRAMSERELLICGRLTGISFRE